MILDKKEFNERMRKAFQDRTAERVVSELRQDHLEEVVLADFIREVGHEMEENGYEKLKAIDLAIETCELWYGDLIREAAKQL